MTVERLPGGSYVKRIGLEVLGWGLVVAGIAALILPGPGLLMLFGGLAVLSRQYEWAERRLRPVEVHAKRAAYESVQSWPRIAVSVLAASWFLLTGLLWLLRPSVPGWWPFGGRIWQWFVQGAVPTWWPFDRSWWFVGSWPVAVTLIASALLALGLIVYSFRTYRGADRDSVAESAHSR